MMDNNLIEVRSLSKDFKQPFSLFNRQSRLTRAVDHISFSIKKGETLGLVGESGCGKSTTGRMLVRLIQPTSGKIFFKGEEISNKNDRQMLGRRKNLQMIFQNPYGSLDPKMTLRQILAEPLKIHKTGRTTREKRIKELLDIVALKSSFLERRPSEFSGGQCQRIAIARSLAVDPDFIVADEPVSALDVSIQARILNLLMDLQKQLDLTYLFISHDLSVVQYISDRIAVMYLGKIVEMADCDELFLSPLHPYTRMLMDSIPVADPGVEPAQVSWDQPDLYTSRPAAQESSGCCFYERCRFHMDICKKLKPDLKECKKGHWATCHLHDNLQEKKNE